MVLKVVTGKIFKTLGLYGGSSLADGSSPNTSKRPGASSAVRLSKTLDYLIDNLYHYRLSLMKALGQVESGRVEETVPNWEYRAQVTVRVA